MNCFSRLRRVGSRLSPPKFHDLSKDRGAEVLSLRLALRVARHTQGMQGNIELYPSPSTIGISVRTLTEISTPTANQWQLGLLRVGGRVVVSHELSASIAILIYSGRSFM